MKNINPYSILIFSIISIFMLYTLKWSLLYPTLSASVIVFFLITIVCLFLMITVFKGITKNKKFNPHYAYKKYYEYIVVLVVIGTILDGMYSHGYPLLGSLKYGEDFGVPFLHVFTSILASFVAYMLLMVITFQKRHRLKAFVLLSITTICLFLPFSRLIIILTLLNYVWSFIYIKLRSSQFTFKKAIILMLFACVGLYLFGVLGNYRLNVQTNDSTKKVTDSTLIYQIGMPSQSFINSKIPSPYFWDYIYLTSSIGNLQNMITYSQSSSTDIKKFVITQFFPDTISKKVYSDYSDEVKFNTFQYQISPSLNVGTIFYEPYYLFGWLGVYLMLFFLLVFPILYLLIIQNVESRYFIYGLSVLNTIYVFMLFDNMFTLSVLSLQLLIPPISMIVIKNKNS